MCYLSDCIRKRGSYVKKAKFLIVLKLLLILFCVLPINVNAQDVEYDLTRQEIIAQIGADGSVKFEDKQTYDVKYFNGVYFNLDRTGYEVRDYRVGILDPLSKQVEYLNENPIGSPGSYQLTQSSDFYKFKVFYPTRDEQVTFVFEYTLADLITNFSDTAELNRKIVGSNTDEYMDVSATIVLPGKVQNKDDFRAWGHGAPQGEVHLTDYEGKSAIRLEVPNNPPNQFVEVITIFPTALTPNNSNRRQVAKKEEIIERENGQVERDREAYASKLGWLRFITMSVGVLMPIAPLGVLFYYVTKKRELNPNPVKLPDHIYELPEDISPAIMATSVFRNTPTTDDLTATIVDLARKNFIRLTPITKEKRGLFSRGETTTVQIDPGRNFSKSKTLQKHEQYALSYILPKGVTTNLQQIEEDAAKDKHFAKQQYQLWTSFVNVAQVRGMQLKGSVSEQTLALALGIIGVVLIPFGIVIGTSMLLRTPYEDYLGLFLMIGGGAFIASILLLIWMKFNPIRTADQERRIQEWTGFKNMLNDVGNFKMRDIASLELWEEFLVYAVSLGVADKVVDAMKIQFEPIELDNLQVGRGFYSNPYLFTRVMNHSVQNSVQISQPRTSSYSGTNSGGFGGGFSGGSSGGSGGGSGSGGF